MSKIDLSFYLEILSKFTKKLWASNKKLWVRKNTIFRDEEDEA